MPAAPKTHTIPFDLCARILDRGLGRYVRVELAKALGTCRLVDPDGDFVANL